MKSQSKSYLPCFFAYLDSLQVIQHESYSLPTALLSSLTNLAQRNYDAHVNHLRSVIDNEKAITILHVPFGPASDPSAALGANSKVGATEVVFFYFPSSLTDTGRDDIMASVDKMRPVMDRSESLEVFDGWALEEEVPNPGPQASEGEKSKVFVNLVGWVDVEAHERFQGSQDFQESIHHIMGIKDMRHTELYHAKLFAA